MICFTVDFKNQILLLNIKDSEEVLFKYSIKYLNINTKIIFLPNKGFCGPAGKIKNYFRAIFFDYGTRLFFLVNVNKLCHKNRNYV